MAQINFCDDKSLKLRTKKKRKATPRIFATTSDAIAQAMYADDSME